MWIMSEVDAIKKTYKEIDHVRVRDFLSGEELDAIEESAIYNLKKLGPCSSSSFQLHDNCTNALFMHRHVS